MAAAVGAALGNLSLMLGLDPLFSYSVIMALALFICLGMGPSLRAWRLTWEHSIVEGGQRTGAVKVG
jgi:hypothetical protein